MGTAKLGRPVGADGPATRGKILMTARRLIAEQGYTATSMREIARAADVTLGTIYHYFTEKTHIYRAVLEEVSAFIEPRLLARVEEAPTFIEAFQGLIDEGARINAEDPSYTQFLASVPAQRRIDPELARLGDPGRERRQLRALVEKGMSTGEIDPAQDPEALVRLFASMISGVAYMSSEGWDAAMQREVLLLMARLVRGDLIRSEARSGTRGASGRPRRHPGRSESLEAHAAPLPAADGPSMSDSDPAFE